MPLSNGCPSSKAMLQPFSGFWLQCAAAWTFAVLVMRQADLAELIGAVVRFVFITSFFWWILQHGDGFARTILQSTARLAGESSAMNGLDYGAFATIGLQILIQTAAACVHFSTCGGDLRYPVGHPYPDRGRSDYGQYPLGRGRIATSSFTPGSIFLAFGAMEWSREMSIGYYKTILAYGIKLMTTLLLAGIGLSILQGIQAQAGQGWGTDMMNLGIALITAAIVLGIIAKAPGVVAGITGVSTNGSGGHGWGSFLGGAFTAASIGSGAAGAAVQGGKQLGQAVRNAVRQGQALSRGRP